MKQLLKVAAVFLFCLFPFCLHAQFSPDTALLMTAAKNFSRLHPANILFVHTDKNLYTNNETIWFSSYLIENEGSELADHNILSVSLVKEDNRSIELQANYFMVNGLSFGSLLLPDSIIPGNYQLQAFTNVVGSDNKPQAVYTQPIVVKTIHPQEFDVSVRLLDSLPSNEGIRARFQITQDLPSRERRQIKYQVGKFEKTINLRENFHDFLIPQEYITQEKSVLITSVKLGKRVQHVSVPLPGPRSTGIDVLFFPEGGNLISGIPQQVGWEAKTRSGLPLALEGILLKDNLQVQSLSTNLTGIGKFEINADSLHDFAIRIKANNHFPRDTVIQLPKPVDVGLVLRLEDAVADSTIGILLRSKLRMALSIVVHNYREIFGVYPSQADSKGVGVKLQLSSLPKGIAVITILDSLQRPLAERLFFAHYNQKVFVDIELDKKELSRKQELQVHIKFTNPDDVPQKSLVSISAVQANRIDPQRVSDIETHIYLNSFLGVLPRDPTGRGFENKSYLEDMLLVKGWRRYTWQELIDPGISPGNLPVAVHPAGSVTYYNKSLKKSIEINTIRDSLIDVFTTESDGTFSIPVEKLLVNAGRTMLISVNRTDKRGYKINLDNPFEKIHESMASRMDLRPTGFANFISSRNQELKGLNQMQQLQEVVVTARSTDLSLYSTGFGPNACGDYVCSYGILNCRNHLTGTPPVRGKTYQGRFYFGCTEEDQTTLFKQSGIYLTKEFYPLRKEDLIETNFLSTLLWKPGVLSDNSGEIKTSFFTGDIKGEFRIVVQGITINDAVYGETSFTVK